MVHVTGTVHDVADNPDRVERIVVRAVEPRMHGTTYVTEESAQFPVVNGVLDFDVLPGACVVAFLRSHGATTYEKLMVPDVTEATFRECLDAGVLLEEGTRSAIEKVVRQIQEELDRTTPLVGEIRTLHTEVSNDRTAVEGFAKAAQTSAAEAATSESNAKGHETTAGDFAAVATTAATEAVNALEGAADLATHEYVDNAVADSLHSPRILLHTDTSEPVLSKFPDARVGDVIERENDGSRWKVGSGQTLIRTADNFYNLNLSHRILNRNGEESGLARMSRQGNVVSLTFDFPVPEGGPSPGQEVFHLPSALWRGMTLYWPPGYAGDDSNMYLRGSYIIYPGTSRKWIRRQLTWITSAEGVAVTRAELLSPPPQPTTE